MKLGAPYQNDLLDTLKEAFPREWKKLCPRYVEPPHGYCAEKHIAATFLTNIYMWAEGKLGHIQAGDGPEVAAYIGGQLALHKMPTYYISGALLDAIMLSDLPPDIRWPEMPLPMPAATFMLPVDRIKHGTEGSIYWISYSVGETETEFTHPITGTTMGLKCHNGARKVLLAVTSTMEDDLAPLYHTVLNSDTPFVTQQAIADAFAGVHGQRENKGAFDIAVTEEDGQFQNLILSMLFRIIMVMNAEPTLVSHGGFTGKRLKSGREVWAPNFVGRNYRYEKRPTSSDGGGWTVRPHWRRGHFRQQAHGPSFSLHKTLWIKPRWIDSSDEKTA